MKASKFTNAHKAFIIKQCKEGTTVSEVDLLPETSLVLM